MIPNQRDSLPSNILRSPLSFRPAGRCSGAALPALAGLPSQLSQGLFESPALGDERRVLSQQVLVPLLERVVLLLPSEDFLRGSLNNADEALSLPLTVDVGTKYLREGPRI